MMVNNELDSYLDYFFDDKEKKEIIKLLDDISSSMCMDDVLENAIIIEGKNGENEIWSFCDNCIIHVEKLCNNLNLEYNVYPYNIQKCIVKELRERTVNIQIVNGGQEITLIGTDSDKSKRIINIYRKNILAKI